MPSPIKPFGHSLSAAGPAYLQHMPFLTRRMFSAREMFADARAHHGKSAYELAQAHRNLVAESSPTTPTSVFHYPLPQGFKNRGPYEITPDDEMFIGGLNLSLESAGSLRDRLLKDDDLKDYFRPINEVSDHQTYYYLNQKIYEGSNKLKTIFYKGMPMIGPAERIYLARQLRALQLDFFLEGQMYNHPIFFDLKTAEIILDKRYLVSPNEQMDTSRHVAAIKNFQNFLVNRGKPRALEAMLIGAGFMSTKKPLDALFLGQSFRELNKQMKNGPDRLGFLFDTLDRVFLLAHEQGLLSPMGHKFYLSQKQISLLITKLIEETPELVAPWQRLHRMLDETGLLFEAGL